MPLLLKLETKSSPVLGVSFHHKKPFVLASLENGIIQLWDYKNFAIIRQYEGHDGAVRGICFHTADPIFASGGDDNILKVWNVEDGRCISLLRGHDDIIRSCSFHHTIPWIISSSNDKTVRIWNWRKKQCVAKLIGYRTAVTGAIFLPKFVISTSTDGKIVIFDIRRLIWKHTSAKNGIGAETITQSGFYQNDSWGGLNCVAFNEETSILVVGCDEKKVVVYNYRLKLLEKCGQLDKSNIVYPLTLLDKLGHFEGHDNIINSIAFRPHSSYAITCSEDKSIRIWLVASQECIDILRYQKERFGVLAAHPSSSLFAAGHENGMILFKNRREKPVFCVNDGFVYYMKDDNTELRKLNLITKKDVFIHKLECDSYSNPRRSLSFNSVENAFIVMGMTHDRKNCQFEFYKRRHLVADGEFDYHCAQSSERRAFWITRKQFVVLNKSFKIELRDLKNSTMYELDAVADDIFYAGTEMILLKIDDEYKLFDVKKKTVIASVQLRDAVRYVIWSESKEYVAFLSKKKLVLLNRKLEILCIQEELNNLKSGCWIDESVFVYNTRYQVKYALTSGDSGIIKTLDLDKQLYIFTARERNLCCFDREANIVEVPFESFEYKIKLSIFHGRIDEALRLLKSERVKFVGHSILEFLVKLGHLDIALNFSKSDRTRFLFCMKYGNLEKALEFAERLDEDISFTTLAEAALLQGNHEIVEICYQKTNNYERLSFLYFVTGNTVKLKELMRKIDDMNARFQISLLVGDVGERIRILKRCGQTSLAYLAAVTHRYDDEVNELKKDFEFNGRSLPKTFSNAKFLTPPRPFHRIVENWPVVKFAGSLEDSRLGASNTFEDKVFEEAPVEEQIEEQLAEYSKGKDDYEEILDGELNNVSLGGVPGRERNSRNEKREMHSSDLNLSCEEIPNDTPKNERPEIIILTK